MGKLLLIFATLVLLAFLPLSPAQRRGTVRLWRAGASSSPNFTSGRVQIYINEQWGNICDDAQFSFTEAFVICHQLGYSGAFSQSRQSLDGLASVVATGYMMTGSNARTCDNKAFSSWTRFGNDSFPILVDDVDCSTTSFLVILQCTHNFVIGSDCVNGRDDASVSCCESNWNTVMISDWRWFNA